MSDINKEIKNVESFRKKLNSFLDTYNNENIKEEVPDGSNNC